MLYPSEGFCGGCTHGVAGHDGTARELARRLRIGGLRVDRVDFLDLLPGGLGAALCALCRRQLEAGPRLS